MCSVHSCNHTQVAVNTSEQAVGVCLVAFCRGCPGFMVTRHLFINMGKRIWHLQKEKEREWEKEKEKEGERGEGDGEKKK